jgi:hypothetical protein
MKRTDPFAAWKSEKDSPVGKSIREPLACNSRHSYISNTNQTAHRQERMLHVFDFRGHLSIRARNVGEQMAPRK